jgi:hypothetical protein
LSGTPRGNITPACIQSAPPSGAGHAAEIEGYTEQDEHIVSVSIDSGAVTVLAPTDPSGGWLTGIAVDATHVYWSTDFGRIYRVIR